MGGKGVKASSLAAPYVVSGGSPGGRSGAEHGGEDGGGRNMRMRVLITMEPIPELCS